MTIHAIASTTLGALVTALLIIAEHYGLLMLWKQAVRRAMPPIARYAVGTLAIIIPTGCVYLYLGELNGWQAAAILFFIAATAGFVTVMSYAIDATVERINGRGH